VTWAFALILLSAIVAGATSSYMSSFVRNGGPVWMYMLVAAWMPTVTWMFAVRYSRMNLLATNVLWNAAFLGAWTLVTVCFLRGASGPAQVIGAVLVLAGLVLLGT